jgi:hypothetical protein
VIDLVAALEGVPLGDAIRRCAVLAGIDPDLRESAVERAVRRSRDEERAAEAQEIELHRRALRSALADTHRHLDEHRARLRAAGPLGPPNEVEQGLLDYCDYLEMELRELRRRPDWELADLWAGWRVENAVALLLRGQSDAA